MAHIISYYKKSAHLKEIFIKEESLSLSGCSGTMVVGTVATDHDVAHARSYYGRMRERSSIHHRIAEHTRCGRGAARMYVGYQYANRIGKVPSTIRASILYIGGKKVAVLSASKNKSHSAWLCDPYQQLPMYLTDPHTACGISKLVHSGCMPLPAKPGTRLSKCLTKLPPLKATAIHPIDVGRTVYINTYSNKITFNRGQFDTYHPVHETTPSVHHWSPESINITRLPWWAKLELCNRRRVVPPRELRLLAARVLLQSQPFNSKSTVPFGYMASNMISDAQHDTINFIVAFAEHAVRSKGGIHGVHYICVDGTRLYYSLFPIVYTSPPHSHHQCTGVILSTQPITWVNK